MLLAPTQAAWQGAKDARAQLGKVAADAQVNIQVARQTRRKHAFTAIMELLNKLHQAAQLRTSLRCVGVWGACGRAVCLVIAHWQTSCQSARRYQVGL